MNSTTSGGTNIWINIYLSTVVVKVQLRIFFFFFNNNSGALSEKAENWGSCTESSSAVCPGCYQLQFLMKNYGKIWQKSQPQRARLDVG